MNTLLGATQTPKPEIIILGMANPSTLKADSAWQTLNPKQMVGKPETLEVVVGW